MGVLAAGGVLRRYRTSLGQGRGSAGVGRAAEDAEDSEDADGPGPAPGPRLPRAASTPCPRASSGADIAGRAGGGLAGGVGGPSARGGRPSVLLELGRLQSLQAPRRTQAEADGESASPEEGGERALWAGATRPRGRPAWRQGREPWQQGKDRGGRGDRGLWAAALKLGPPPPPSARPCPASLRVSPSLSRTLLPIPHRWERARPTRAPTRGPQKCAGRGPGAKAPAAAAGAIAWALPPLPWLAPPLRRCW